MYLVYKPTIGRKSWQFLCFLDLKDRHKVQKLYSRSQVRDLSELFRALYKGEYVINRYLLTGIF